MFLFFMVQKIFVKLSTIYLLNIENPEACILFVPLTWILGLKYSYSYFSTTATPLAGYKIWQ